MTAVATLPLDRTDPLDPPPAYRALAAQERVFQVRTPRGDLAWVVSRLEDVRQALTDRALSSDPRTPGFPTYLTGDVPPPPGFFMQADAPDHTRLRRLVTREFLVSHMEALRPRIEENLRRIVADLGPVDSADLVSQVALPIAASTICELLGAPFDDYPLFVRLTDTVLSRTSTPEEATGAAVELLGYFDRLVTAKRQHPTDDVFSRLVAREEAGDATHEELVGLATLLLLGGYDTMAQMIGLGVYALLRHPDELARLREDPSLAPDAVEELLRYLTVNHSGLPRGVLADTEIGGQTIRAGEGVIVMLNAANRDEDAFTDPDALDLTRGSRDHVAFGHGFHKCIGLTLARIELQVVFTTIFDLLPGLRCEVSEDDLPFRHDMVLYGLRSLPVGWDR